MPDQKPTIPPKVYEQARLLVVINESIVDAEPPCFEHWSGTGCRQHKRPLVYCQKQHDLDAATQKAVPIAYAAGYEAGVKAIHEALAGVPDELPN